MGINKDIHVVHPKLLRADIDLSEINEKDLESAFDINQRETELLRIISTYYNIVTEVLNSVEDIQKLLTEGSEWIHLETGNRYKILFLSNLKSTKPDSFPIMVNYVDSKGVRWSRPLHKWITRYIKAPTKSMDIT